MNAFRQFCYQKISACQNFNLSKQESSAISQIGSFIKMNA
ncbi:uncharacterized protein Dmul_22780 [Desulfococcus multivorans]|nr:uncharacterized protein Dmul_22780 [Desulfococcus multivorans]